MYSYAHIQHQMYRKGTKEPYIMKPGDLSNLTNFFSFWTYLNATTPATGPALIFVGAMMMGNLLDIDWSNVEQVLYVSTSESKCV